MNDIELLSIDLSNYCSKQCPFCYNHSHREGNIQWRADEVIAFASDCIDHGVKSVSLGGGEPFEYPGIFEVIEALYPKCYLSVTTNGLPLEDKTVLGRLERTRPDKIHVSIHQPQSTEEVDRVMTLMGRLSGIGVKPGVNLLVGADKVDAARDVYSRLTTILESDQIILIPQRYSNTPTPRQLASVAAGKPFQSPSCLLECRRPSNFASVSWDKRANSCSYAPGKVALPTLDWQGLIAALESVSWDCCVR